MKKFDKYIQKAEKMGAIDAVIINSSDIVIDPRTLLKCMYGCETWGKNWTCPSVPNALQISYELERDAFVDGYYFAFSMSDCDLCKDCKYPEPCKHPKKARPALQGLGIDVYATVRKQGLPIKTLKSEDEEQNWYSLVLIE
jgi:predicted metal-binding protein